MVRFFVLLLSTLFLLTVFGLGGAAYTFWHYGRGLPDYRQLADYEPPVMTRLYAGDGRLITEYAVEKRTFVPIEVIPRRVIDAFLSAEDKTFYSHPGIDIPGLVRAVLTNIKNVASGRRPVGASTITQQVAKNFLLTNEVSVERKVKEAILTLRIEQTFSKDHILELYLNEIYLGFGSYGVAAAAMNYFNKSLDQLTLAEAAFLAALPKAPNNYHPIRRHESAVARRDWVISRMMEDGHITQQQAEDAWAEPLLVRSRDETEYVDTGAYFAEEVRRELLGTFGEEALYKGGLAVRTTLDPEFQQMATGALQEGLMEYDRRHGWRGPITQISVDQGWVDQLRAVQPPVGALEGWRLAVVVAIAGGEAKLGFSSGAIGAMPFAEMKWARPWIEGQRFGAPPKAVSDVVQAGDVVLVEPVSTTEDGKEYPEGMYALRQLPAINGALVAMDPHTGRVLAMTGGFSMARSEFNRATQALRQPGSAFKPFVYLAALEQGYTPSTLVLDAPFVYDQGPGLPKWKPKNYSGSYDGPSTLRTGIEKSRNLMTVRLANAIGMDAVAEKAETFGIDRNFPRLLAASLGAGETTLLQMTTAYAMLANGGRRVMPTLIDRVQDRNGETIFKHDKRSCQGCQDIFWTGQGMPKVADTRQQIADPRSVYQMVHILQGVVQNGTGRRLRELGVPMAGKTGTTNDSYDTWFMGFTPDLVAGVFVGFDDPKTLGNKETGSSVALPIFKRFMEQALQDVPVRPFKVPEGIQLVRVDHETGRLAQPGDEDVILEAFKTGNMPSYTTASVIDGSASLDGEKRPGGELFTDGDIYPGWTPSQPSSEGSAVSTPRAGGLY